MDDARLFLCARCRCQVLICSRCDRGQQYCGARCSGLARRESLRGAGHAGISTRDAAGTVMPSARGATGAGAAKTRVRTK